MSGFDRANFLQYPFVVTDMVTNDDLTTVPENTAVAPGRKQGTLKDALPNKSLTPSNPIFDLMALRERFPQLPISQFPTASISVQLDGINASEIVAPDAATLAFITGSVGVDWFVSTKGRAAFLEGMHSSAASQYIWYIQNTREFSFFSQTVGCIVSMSFYMVKTLPRVKSIDEDKGNETALTTRVVKK